MKEKVCEGCGARLREDADRCDLCGTAVAGAGEANDEEVTEAASAPQEPPLPAAEAPVAVGQPESAGVFCNACGWQNPLGARFCSQCGARLDERVAAVRAGAPAGPVRVKTTPAAPPPPAAGVPSPDEATARGSAAQGVGRQVAVVVGAGVLLVVGLYMISVLSAGMRQGPPASSPAAASAPAPGGGPLPDDVAARADALLEEINSLSGEEALDKRRELIRLYAGAGRYDLAASEQKSLAQRTGAEQDWILAGNLYYDWMERQAGAGRAVFAKQAIAAYQKALEINPDNLDVRTDMAIAYMYDPDNPMKAIQETNAVLERDSTHVQANFNRGVMLMQINRIDQAIAQFEKVKALIGDPNDPVYQRAEQAIQALRNGPPAAGS